jgi:hypothetical protein
VFALERKKERKKESKKEFAEEFLRKRKTTLKSSFFIKKILRKNERRSKIGCLRRLRPCRVFLKNLVLEGRKH